MRPISSSDTARLITDLDTCDTCDAETRDTCTHLVTIVLTGDRRHTKLPTVNHTGAVVTAGRMKPDNRSDNIRCTKKRCQGERTNLATVNSKERTYLSDTLAVFVQFLLFYDAVQQLTLDITPTDPRRRLCRR